MHRLNSSKYRKPDFLLILVAVVGLALAATLTLQVHALSSEEAHVEQSLISQSGY